MTRFIDRTGINNDHLEAVRSLTEDGHQSIKEVAHLDFTELIKVLRDQLNSIL